MTTRPLITRSACESCDDAVREGDTGAVICRANPCGDFECSLVAAVGELVEKAVASAEHWQTRIRHTPAPARHEAIEAEAGLYEDWAAALGAEFNAAAWITRCGEAQAVAA